MSPSELSAALPGFDDPLGLLRACHTKILSHCDLLDRLPDTPDPAIARQVYRYFSISAPLHHHDEEQDLFPLLLRHGATQAARVQQLLDEHATLERLWDSIAGALQTLPASGCDAHCVRDVRAFSRLNRAHVDIENRHVLPAAAALFGAAEIRQLGTAMAARRGVQLAAL